MTSRQYTKLLTIAIPTYNRASFLDLCLSHICEQLGKGATRVELLVSDNDSTDSTSDVVGKYINSGYTINYIKNKENIGPDRNCLQCFNLANGKYVLILGDDDILLDGSLTNILDIIGKDDYGVVHLRSYGFIEDFKKERPAGHFEGHIIYTDIKEFLHKASYFLTFVSTNVVNKSLVSSRLELNRFLDSNLVQLGWTFSALFNSKKNVYVKEFMVAAKLYNSGGYKLCQVFGVNSKKVFDMFANEEGVDREFFKIINKKMLLKFFPANIIRSRMNMTNVKDENPYNILFPLYKKYLYFWVFTVPAIMLPKKVAFFIYSIVDRLRKILGLPLSLVDYIRDRFIGKAGK